MPLTIYKSSAGSGKTFTLVKEFLKIVLKDPNEYKHVLAITFTNKATEEMKTRIVDELNVLAHGTNSDMRQSIEADFQENNLEVNIAENAKMVLNRILHNYARFEVSTIDSFFSQVIRSFARELNLPLQYSIDMDSDKALDHAIEQLYNSLHHKEEVTDWLNHFTKQNIKNNKGWNIDRSIQDMGKQLFKENFHAFKKDSLSLEELKGYTTSFQQEKVAFEDQMLEYVEQVQAILKKAALVPKDFKRGAYSYFKNMEENQKYEPPKTFLDIVTGETTWYAKNSSKIQHFEDAIELGLNEIAQKIFGFYENNHQRYYSNKSVLETIYSYGILNALNQELKVYRDEQNLLLISDTNALIKEAIAQQDAPLILEKVGSWYKHILIDEFQDTSNFQWHNLLPLLINSLSDDHQVLIVGDVKQSIYRWRGGNMKLLLEQVQKDLGQYPAKVEVLGNNFRSKANIVNFNNAFFENAVRGLATAKEEVPNAHFLEAAYEAHQQVPQKEDGGYIDIQFLEKADKKNPPEIPPHEEAVIHLIQQALKDGYAYEDIFVLVNRNEESVLLAKVLANTQIPFITSQSLLLKNAPVIQLLISFLQYFNNSFDPLIRTKLLYKYCRFKGIEIKDLDEIFTDYQNMPQLEEKEKKQETNPEDIFEGLPENFDYLTSEEVEVIEEQTQLLFDKIMPAPLTKNLHEICRKPLVEIVEELIVILELNNGINNYIQRFQDIGLEVLTKGISNVSDFLEYWDEKKKALSILSSKGTNAIRIMTIHKAKGLEAPIVILPFATYKFYNTIPNIIWVNVQHLERYQDFKILPLKYKSDLEHTDFQEAYEQEKSEIVLDTLNKAYVAFTRPKERLYVVCDMPKKKDPNVKTLHNLLYLILNQPNFPFHTYFSKEDMRFTYGEPTPKVIKKEEQQAEEKALIQENILETYFSESYKGKLNIRAENANYFEILDDVKSQNISAGIKAHTVLEKWDHKSDLQQVVEQLILDRVLQEMDKEPILEKIHNLLRREKFQNWFEKKWDVRERERAILHKGQYYRPDCVMYNDEATIIVDYKKEKRNPSHQKQIMVYAKILHQMGSENIRAYLVYVETAVIDVHYYKPNKILKDS